MISAGGYSGPLSCILTDLVCHCGFFWREGLPAAVQLWNPSTTEKKSEEPLWREKANHGTEWSDMSITKRIKIKIGKERKEGPVFCQEMERLSVKGNKCMKMKECFSILFFVFLFFPAKFLRVKGKLGSLTDGETV
jgi:hypothetical protein